MDPARREALVARARVKAALRARLAAWGYVELDAPLLVRGTCPDVALDSFTVPGAGADAYLTTSTEYAIKRAIAGGLDAAYTLTANFRRGEVSPTHNPEFTMLEWGAAGASLDRICAEAEALVAAGSVALTGGTRVVRGGRAIEVAGPWPRLPVVRAIATLAGLPEAPELPLPWLLEAARALDVDVPDAWAEDAVTVLTLLLDHLQPLLGADGPVWLVDWPAVLTSSTDGAVPGAVIERAELFCAGLELADGFPFQTDAAVARAAMDAALARRRGLGLDPVALDHAYLRALGSGLPAGAGMALGFDRLMMLLTGATGLRGVLLQAWDER